MNSHSFCGKASKFGLLNKTWGRPSSLYINRFPVLLMLVNRRTTCAPMNWRTECSAMAAGSRKQTAPVYQRTTAAAEVERSWSSIRSLVYIASTDETNERRQTHQFLKGGITHVTWAVRGLTRINVGTSHWAIQHSR